MLKLSNLSKAQKEDMMCRAYNGKAIFKMPNMAIAESDYEHSLACPPEYKEEKTKFDIAREILKQEDL
jgi:hypothetical protein